MVCGIVIQGTKLTLLTGADFPKTAPRAANDNGTPPAEMTVTVRRTLEKSGVPIKIKVPVAEYVGVAVGTVISEDGELRSTIELVHQDSDLNYKVFEEEGNASVVAEWQNWGKKLRLPLYIKAGGGEMVPFSQQVDGVALGRTTSRRMLAADAERRTRFARRRKTGEQG